MNLLFRVQILAPWFRTVFDVGLAGSAPRTFAELTRQGFPWEFGKVIMFKRERRR